MCFIPKLPWEVETWRIYSTPSTKRSHIPPWKKENHFQKCQTGGDIYVSSQEGICFSDFDRLSHWNLRRDLSPLCCKKQLADCGNQGMMFGPQRHLFLNGKTPWLGWLLLYKIFLNTSSWNKGQTCKSVWKPTILDSLSWLFTFYYLPYEITMKSPFGHLKGTFHVFSWWFKITVKFKMVIQGNPCMYHLCTQNGGNHELVPAKGKMRKDGHMREHSMTFVTRSKKKQNTCFFTISSIRIGTMPSCKATINTGGWHHPSFKISPDFRNFGYPP